MMDGNLQLLQHIAASSSRIEDLLGKMQPVVADMRELSTRKPPAREKPLDPLDILDSEDVSSVDEWRDLKESMVKFRSLLGENPRLVRVISQLAAQDPSLDTTESPVTTAASRLHQAYVEKSLASEPDSQVTVNPSANHCVCRGFSYTTQLEPLSIIHFRHVFRRKHYRHCPKFNEAEQSLEIMMRIIPPSWLLRHTINIGIHVRNWHTIRGLSITPAVTGGSRVVDARVSPSFRAIVDCHRRLVSTEFRDASIRIRDLLWTLKDVFESQQGSPLDEDVRGNTVLHEVLRFFVGQFCFNHKAAPPDNFITLIQFLLRHGANPNTLCSGSQSSRSRDDTVQGSGTILNIYAASLRLLDSGGCRCNETKHKDKTAEIGDRLYKALVDTGAEFSRPMNTLARIFPAAYCKQFKQQLMQYKAFPEQLDLSDHKPLVASILIQDEKRFSQLQPGSNINHVSCVNGLTAVHFAVAWPWALERLIQAGADVNRRDHYRRSPIQLAVSLRMPVSVNMLIEADCSLFTPSHADSLLHEALEPGASLAVDHRIVDSVVKALADRHRRLINFARASLPEITAFGFEMQRDDFKEDMVPVISKELTANGVNMPPALQLDGKSVYRGSNSVADIFLTPPIAQELWVSGFHQVNVEEPGCPSSMLRSWHMANFDMVLWLQGKGVPIDSTEPTTGRSGLHFYAEGLLYRMFDPPQGFPGTGNNKKPIRQLIEDETTYHDNCSCLCSLNGCTPLSKLPRLTKARRLDSIEQFCEKRIRKLNRAYRHWIHHLGLEGVRYYSRFLKKMMRAVAFENLGGIHTCCITRSGIDVTGTWRSLFTRKMDEHEELDFLEKLELTVEEYNRRLELCCCPQEGKLPCLLSEDGDDGWHCLLLKDSDQVLW